MQLDMQQKTKQQLILQRIRLILFIKDIETAELILTASTYWWAYSFMQTKEYMLSIPVYVILTRTLPHIFWVISWWILSICLTGGLLTGNYKWRRFILLSSAAAWIFTGILLWTSPVPSLWHGQAIIFGLTAIWGYVRLRLSNEPLESFMGV